MSESPLACPVCGKHLGDDKTGFDHTGAYCIHGDDMLKPGHPERQEVKMVKAPDHG